MKIPLTLPPAGRSMDVIALGENSLDAIAVGDFATLVNAKTRLEALHWLPGGQAATAAVACARLGWRSRYIGCVGNDLAATTVETALKQSGVDVVLHRRQARTRTAIVLVDRSTGNRTVLEYREPELQLRPADIDDSLIVAGRLLLVDASEIDASIRAAASARQAGIPTMVDADRGVEGIDRLLALIDILIVPESFARSLTGEADVSHALARLEARFRPAVVVATLGDQGSLARCRGREIRTVPPVIRVRDTTGAGDAFRGGFAAGWLDGGADAEIERVLTTANAVAALSCRELGAQTALPTRGELAAIL